MVAQREHASKCDHKNKIVTIKKKIRFLSFSLLKEMIIKKSIMKY